MARGCTSLIMQRPCQCPHYRAMYPAGAGSRSLSAKPEQGARLPIAPERSSACTSCTHTGQPLPHSEATFTFPLTSDNKLAMIAVIVVGLLGKPLRPRMEVHAV